MQDRAIQGNLPGLKRCDLEGTLSLEFDFLPVVEGPRLDQESI